jgi:hypothetical protein
VHEEKLEGKKESLEPVNPWRANSRECWSIFGVNWSWITKESGFQA